MLTSTAFETRLGRRIPGTVMQFVAQRLQNGEDGQKVMTEELRSYIPEHDDDLDEAWEVIGEAQDRNAEAALDRGEI